MRNTFTLPPFLISIVLAAALAVAQDQTTGTAAHPEVLTTGSAVIEHTTSTVAHDAAAASVTDQVTTQAHETTAPDTGTTDTATTNTSTSAPAAAPTLTSETLRVALDQLFDAPEWSNAHWGVKIVDLTTSELLYEREANKGFMPASNMKLYTTAAALYALGPQYTYKTDISAIGPIENSVLKGDLVITGSGDPSISGRYVEETQTTSILRNWAKAVRDAGIRRIDGAVVGDDDCFDDQYIPGTWQFDYYQEWYAAESSGLSINDNCWDAVIFPAKKAGEKARVVQAFPTRYYRVKNLVRTTASHGQTTDTPNISISRPLDENDITLAGTIAADARPYREWGSVRNGTLYAATLLTEELERAGIRIAKGAKDIDDLADKSRFKGARLRKLVTHESVPLSRTLAIINKPSQNFYADQLLKTLGKEMLRRGDFDSGERVVGDFLTTAGADSRNLRMADGSGLSRQNLVEPQMTLAILQAMAAHPHFQYFYDSLPIMGIDGTLKTRMKGTPLQGNVRAKTGYIGRVRSLSGYLDTEQKHRIAFAMMVNNYTVETRLANDTQDTACLHLLRYKSE